MGETARLTRWESAQFLRGHSLKPLYDIDSPLGQFTQTILSQEPIIVNRL